MRRGCKVLLGEGWSIDLGWCQRGLESSDCKKWRAWGKGEAVNIRSVILNNLL
jgi:hypothetical protein